MELKAKIPPGTFLSPVAQAVFKVLERYTSFPWPVLAAQCKRVGTAPEFLDGGALPALIPLLAAGVGRFTSPEKENAVRKELQLVAMSGREAR